MHGILGKLLVGKYAGAAGVVVVVVAVVVVAVVAAVVVVVVGSCEYEPYAISQIGETITLERYQIKINSKEGTSCFRTVQPLSTINSIDLKTVIC